MKASRSQDGFTLLEVMVVVVIIAIMSSLSMLALNQASDRRYLSQADDLLAWFQQISELAVLEGVAYGLVRDNQTLHSMVFYRQRWHMAANPEPFQLFNNAVINIAQNKRFNTIDTGSEALLPDIVMLPGGYIEPTVTINLSFRDQSSTYSYLWDDLTSTLEMQRNLKSNSQ